MDLPQSGLQFQRDHDAWLFSVVTVGGRYWRLAKADKFVERGIGERPEDVMDGLKLQGRRSPSEKVEDSVWGGQFDEPSQIGRGHGFSGEQALKPRTSPMAAIILFGG